MFSKALSREEKYKMIQRDKQMNFFSDCSLSELDKTNSYLVIVFLKGMSVSPRYVFKSIGEASSSSC